MSRKSYPNVNAANQYARDVVRGKIVACQFVIQACQRHLDDLMAEKSKSFRYRFDKDLAERAAKFIQLLPHTKGGVGIQTDAHHAGAVAAICDLLCVWLGQ